jgi:O-antigen ligase
MSVWLQRWNASQQRWPGSLIRLAVALVAVIAGVTLTRLPLLDAAILLLLAILLPLTLIEPMVGLAVSLLFATFKPLTDYFVPQLPLDIGQLALIVTLGSWLLHALRRHELNIPRTRILLPLLIFLGAASLSLPVALSMGYALKEMIKWAQLIVVMLLVTAEAPRVGWKVVLGMVLAAAVLEALIGVWQFGLRGDGPKHFLILNDSFYRAYGTFEQPNPYGGFLGITTPLALSFALGALGLWLTDGVKSFRAAWPDLAKGLLAALSSRVLPLLVGFGSLAGLLLAALIMSWSRGAWLGFGAAVLAISMALPRRSRWGIGLGAAALLIGYLGLTFNLLPASISARLTDFTSDITQSFDVRGVDITPENYAVMERVAHWQAAESMAQYHPWFGVGLGNYEPVYPGYALLNWPYPLGHAHNIYLNLLAETGTIGLLAYLLVWGMIVAYTWRLTRTSDFWVRMTAIGLLGVWAHLTVHHLVDNLYVANIHLHLGALLGVLSVLVNKSESETVSVD